MSTRKIAIVDDDPAQRTVLKALAQESGFEVVALGKDGNEAIEICKTKAPEIIMMDVSMPEKDGIRAAQEINRLFPTPIVLLTARDDDETIRRAVDAGVMGYLVKPVKLEDLRPAIELAISRFSDLKTLGAKVSELKDTLAERRAVEKAKGLIMKKEGISEDEAFARLRSVSMDKRKSMAEIAEIVILALKPDEKHKRP